MVETAGKAFDTLETDEVYGDENKLPHFDFYRSHMLKELIDSTS